MSASTRRYTDDDDGDESASDGYKSEEGASSSSSRTTSHSRPPGGGGRHIKPASEPATNTAKKRAAPQTPDPLLTKTNPPKNHEPRLGRGGKWYTWERSDTSGKCGWKLIKDVPTIERLNLKYLDIKPEYRTPESVFNTRRSSSSVGRTPRTNPAAASDVANNETIDRRERSDAHVDSKHTSRGRSRAPVAISSATRNPRMPAAIPPRTSRTSDTSRGGLESARDDLYTVQTSTDEKQSTTTRKLAPTALTASVGRDMSKSNPAARWQRFFSPPPVRRTEPPTFGNQRAPNRDRSRSRERDQSSRSRSRSTSPSAAAVAGTFTGVGSDPYRVSKSKGGGALTRYLGVTPPAKESDTSETSFRRFRRPSIRRSAAQHTTIDHKSSQSPPHGANANRSLAPPPPTTPPPPPPPPPIVTLRDVQQQQVVEVTRLQERFTIERQQLDAQQQLLRQQFRLEQLEQERRLHVSSSDGTIASTAAAAAATTTTTTTLDRLSIAASDFKQQRSELRKFEQARSDQLEHQFQMQCSEMRCRQELQMQKMRLEHLQQQAQQGQIDHQRHVDRLRSANTTTTTVGGTSGGGGGGGVKAFSQLSNRTHGAAAAAAATATLSSVAAAAATAVAAPHFLSTTTGSLTTTGSTGGAAPYRSLLFPSLLRSPAATVAAPTDVTMMEDL